jgi:trimeric autotransporter adhesin
MSKNTGTSELINYFDLGVNGDVGIAGSLDINTIANATTDTDTFLVSDTGIIKYRTGAQLLSDIGGQAAGNYVTTDTSQAITANKSFTVGFSLGSEGSGNQTSFFRNTSSLFSGSGGTNIFGFNNSNNIYFGKGLNNGGVLQWNNTTATRYYTLPDADGTIALTSAIPANPIGGTGTSGTIPVFTGSTTIGNSIIQSNATQVNIVGNGSQLLFDSLGSTKDGGIGYTNSFDLLINNSRGVGTAIYLGNVNMDFHTNVSGNPRLRITSGGNVLIGTTTDNGAKLQISGAATVSGSVTAQVNNISADGAGVVLQGYVDNILRIAVRGSGYNDGARGGLLASTADFSSSVRASSLALSGTIANSGDTATLTIKQASTTFTNGIYLERAGERNGYYMYIGGALDALTFRRNYFGTQSDVMSLTRDGSVGIGMTTSDYGRVSIKSNSTTPYAGFNVYATGNGNFTYINHDNSVGIIGTEFGSGGTGQTPLTFQVGGSERMRINTDGRLEFSQISSVPTNNNSIYSTSVNGLLYIQGGSVGLGLAGSGNRNNAIYINSSLNQTTFVTDNSERLRITSGGNILIGTTTDTGAKLNVGGSYMAYPVSIEAGAGGNQLALTRSGAVAEFYMGGSTGGGTQLYVRSGGSGGVRLDAGSTGWVSASDIRLKDVTKPIQKAVESLLGLQTIYYSWKDSINKSLHIGLIAQEVEKVFPELVSESSIDGMKGVNYTELIPVIIKAIQELNEKINK